MNNPLISVIIPAYNHEKYIQETIQGIINQTYLNIELIIINDGSPDNTFQKINEMKDICKKRFVKVIFETQQNQGSCITLNRLLDKVNGDYIAMCASDDVYQPEFIKTCLSFLIKNPKYGACFVDSLFINENSQMIYWGENRITETSSKKAKFKTFGQFLKKARKDVNFNSSDFGSYESLLRENYIPQGALYKADLFKDLRYTKEAPLEDWYINLQLAKKYKLKFIDKPLYAYRWHSENSVKQTDRMAIVYQKTREFEDNLIKKTLSENNYNIPHEIKRVMYNYITYGFKRNILNIFNILNFYRYRNDYYKTFMCKFLNKEYLLYQKKIKQVN